LAGLLKLVTDFATQVIADLEAEEDSLIRG